MTEDVNGTGTRGFDMQTSCRFFEMFVIVLIKTELFIGTDVVTTVTDCSIRKLMKVSI